MMDSGHDMTDGSARQTAAPRQVAGELGGSPGATNLGLPAFFMIWSGQAISLVTSQASQFALVWWLTLETGSPAVLSTATLFALLPMVALGPAIGALVDRWRRRWTMVVADGAVALGSLALAGLFFTGRATTVHVLLFLLWRSIGEAFHAPAMLSATSLMVPRHRLASIQGLNQVLQGLLAILTAPLGALLLDAIGIFGLMAIDVVTALFAIVPLLFISVPEPARRAPESDGARGSLRSEIVAGIRYLRGLPGHLALVAFTMVINLCLTPAFALLPLLVHEELHGEASRLAWLSSAFGCGAIAGGLALGLVIGRFGGGARPALGSILGLGIATLALGLTPAAAFPIAVAAMLFLGGLQAVANGSIQAMMQATIAPEFQGRIFTLMASLATAMTPVGLLLAAPIADLAGVRAWYVAGGTVCAAMGAGAFFVRSILAIDRDVEAAPHTPEPMPLG